METVEVPWIKIMQELMVFLADLIVWASNSKNYSNFMSSSKFPASGSTTVYVDPLPEPDLCTHTPWIYDGTLGSWRARKKKEKSCGKMKYLMLMKVLSKSHWVLKEKYSTTCGMPKNMRDAKKQIAYQIVPSNSIRTWLLSHGNSGTMERMAKCSGQCHACFMA